MQRPKRLPKPTLYRAASTCLLGLLLLLQFFSAGVEPSTADGPTIYLPLIFKRS